MTTAYSFANDPGRGVWILIGTLARLSHKVYTRPLRDSPGVKWKLKVNNTIMEEGSARSDCEAFDAAQEAVERFVKEGLLTRSD